MSYVVQIKPAAERALARLPLPLRRRIDSRILALRENPRPAGCMKLSGFENLYRIRVGEYRVIYEINDRDRIVIIMIVAHRRESYRGL